MSSNVRDGTAVFEDCGETITIAVVSVDEDTVVRIDGDPALTIGGDAVVYVVAYDVVNKAIARSVAVCVCGSRTVEFAPVVACVAEKKPGFLGWNLDTGKTAS